MDARKKSGVFFVILSSLLFSIGGLCVKLIPWSPLAINGARNLIALPVVGAYLLITRHKLRWNLPVAMGALSMVGVTTLFSVANKLTTAANAIVLQFTAPIFVILLSLIIFRVKPTGLDLGACGAVLAGVVLFFVDGLRVGSLAGDLTAVVSGLCYAGVFMMNSSKNADPLSSTFFGQLISAVIFTPLCFSETDFSPGVLVAVAVLGAFQVGLAYIFLSLGIRYTPPITAALITGLEPVLNPIWVALFYHETVTPLSLVGAFIVVGSVVAYNVLKAKFAQKSNDHASCSQD